MEQILTWLFWFLLAGLLIGVALLAWRRSQKKDETPPVKPKEPERVEPIVIPEPEPEPEGRTRIGHYFPVPAAGHPTAMLIGISGAVEGQEFSVEREVFHIGASAENDLSIAQDAYVSADHAYMRFEKGSLFIFDRTSRNGTFVNGVQITNNGYALRPGDYVRVGMSTFEVQGGDEISKPEPVLLGVAAPRQVVPGSSFNARFVAYIAAAKKSAERLLRQSGEKKDRIFTGIPPDRQAYWRIGAPITVRLTGEHLRITPVERTFEWNGRENLANFVVQVDADAPRVTLQICFHVFLGPVQIAFIPVAVRLSGGLTDREPPQVDVRAPSSAFASYSSKDAEAVSRSLSTLAHWAPTLDIFQDCLDLTPNESFKARLAAQIAARDIFLLFWSRNARASKWVLWELETARIKPAFLPVSSFSSIA
jgi:Inner membrane component of T3SS, cytoplasmic domain/TIR domain